MFEKLKKSFAVRMTVIVFLCFLGASAVTIGLLLILTGCGIKVKPGGFTLYVIIAFCASCLIGTVLTAASTQKVSKMYAKFKKAINEVANGNFDVVFPEGEYDLMDQIGKDFNIMVKELKGVQILRNEFISNFSHELKTPITSINGFAELMMADDVTVEERKDYSKIIYDESSRLLTLAKNTLLLSKLEGQAVITEKRVFSLDEMVESCILLMEKQLDEKNITVNTDIEKTSYYWDSNLLSQVVINLISNAIKYNKDGGEINVSLKNDDKNVILKVADTGVGMDKTTLKKVFERYYQADRSHKTEGNGLGLSIVDKIILMCGGKIDIESEEGKGSCFTVTLPHLKEQH